MVKRAALALTLLLLTASCGTEEKAEPIKVKTVAGVKVEPAQVISFIRSDTFSGTVIPDKEVFLSPKVVGYLIKVNVDAGEKVKKGQVLGLIDSSDIKPDVEKAKAGLKEITAALKELDRALSEVEARKKAAEANYQLAEKTYTRFKNLLKADAVSKQKFDEVEAQYKAAKANLEAAKAKEEQILAKRKVLLAKRQQVEASLKKAEAFLSYTELRSPVDGVVLQKLVDKGNLVSPQTPVFKLGSFPLKVRAFIDDTYAGKVKRGTEVKVKVQGREYTGEVVEVDRSSDPVTHKFGVKVLVKGLNAIPGTYAVVEIPSLKAEAVAVPKSAIYRVGAVEYVFVVKDGTAHLRIVKTGEEVGDMVIVLSGLHPGEKVAVTKVEDLVDGARVEG